MTLEINGFEIQGKLGEGGMASVWMARQLSLDRTVAIKVLSNRFAVDADDVRRFLEEAQAAAKLKHPGIVQVHDANAENGVYYFVMEYVAGYTVGDWVRRKGVLAEKDALLVADCVADALGYAWERAKIIHCDIKPDNVIIDEDGTVKVADLGLARTLSAMEVADEIEDEVMGTPAYISPEQALGKSNLDFRADVYALGAMLYHLVTGKMLFSGSSDDETLDQQVSGRVPDPMDLNPKLSKGVCWLIERMMAKDATLRQESWDAVREDIRRVQRGLLPKGRALPDNASTVQRSTRRIMRADYERMARAQAARQAAAKPSVRTAAVAASLAVVAALLMVLYMKWSHVPLVPRPAPSRTVTNVVRVAEKTTAPSSGPARDRPAGADDEARRMYEFALEWSKNNPDAYAASVEHFETVARRTRGTRYSHLAKRRVRELRERRQREVKRVADSIESDVSRLVASNRFDEAVALVLGYNGPFAEESRAERQRVAGSVRDRKHRWEQENRQREIEHDEFRRKRTEALVMAVLADDLPLAEDVVEEMLVSDAFAAQRSVLEEVQRVTDAAGKIDDRIMASFSAQRGDTIDLELSQGVRRLKVGMVIGDNVQCYQELDVGRSGASLLMVGVDDLSTRERLARMGPDSLPEVALAKGIMAFRARAYTHAETYFGLTNPFLAKHLLARLQGGEGLLAD